MKPRKKKKILLLVLLALLCVGAAELVACRFFNPELYYKITAPVVQLAKDVYSKTGELACAAGNAIGDFFVSLFPEEEETDDTQRVTQPLFLDNSPVSDPTITEVRKEGDSVYLTGGPVKLRYFNQTEAPWDTMPYGSDSIGGYGCGPTAMAMVVASMTDTPMDPGKMAKWAVENGQWARRSGSYHTLIPRAANAFGLKVSSLQALTAEEIRSALQSGKLLVALVGPGHFTRSGHFILLRGTTLKGEVLVADPSSLDRSLSVWDAQTILDEVGYSTSAGGPIWVISA